MKNKGHLRRDIINRLLVGLFLIFSIIKHFLYP